MSAVTNPVSQPPDNLINQPLDISHSRETKRMNQSDNISQSRAVTAQSGEAASGYQQPVSQNCNLAWVSSGKLGAQKDGESGKFGGKCELN